jgi:hypothetical protein
MGRLAVVFKARVNLNHAVFNPPPCRGVAQAWGLLRTSTRSTLNLLLPLLIYV